MGSKTRRPLAEMRAIAESLCAELAPYCERIEIAGSIRRRKAEVADIELVCVPKISWRPKAGELFAQESVNLLDEYCDSLMPSTPEVFHARARWQHRLSKDGKGSFGRRFKRVLVPDGARGMIALDLFSCLPPAQWGVLFLIRTGSAEFSRQAVTQRFKGGWLPNGHEVRDGGVYQLQATTSVPTPEERDFFAFCDVPFIEPEARRA